LLDAPAERPARDRRKPAGPNLPIQNKAGFVHTERDPRVNAIPDIHGHAKGEHKSYTEERPLPLTARMLFLWFYHACRRGFPRFLMVTDHMNYLTFEDPAAVNLVRRALKLAQAGDLYGAAETANVEVGHAQVVSEGLRRGLRYSIGAEVDNDPRARPDAQNIVDAMRPDGIIRSVHFLPIEHPVHGPNWPWPFDNPEFASLYDHVGTEKTWEIYMQVLLDAIERLPGHIVGHFYVPAIFGHWPDDATLSGYEDRMLDAVAARGSMAIEFNTRFLYRDHTEEEKTKYLDANARLLRKAKARGIGIAIGSDAHSPRDQASHFETVLEVLDSLEINEIVFPIAGRLLRVALRVVKPPEPPAPEPEPVTAEVKRPPRKPRPEATPARERTERERTARSEKPVEPAAPKTALVKAAPKKSAAAPPKTTTAAPAEPDEPAAPATLEAPAAKAAPKPATAKKVAAPKVAAAAKPAPKAVVKPAPAPKKAAPKKGPVAKKPPAPPARKPALKKAASAKKPAAAARKVAAPAKKPAAKKAPVPAPKRPAVRPPAKKAAPRKPAAKKSPAKKSAAKRR
jgi:HisJ family histidinol phosphate phosphatase